MSTKEDVVSQPNPHTEGAQALVQQLRQMREVIPRFVIPAARRARNRLTTAASVPPEFIELTVVATTNEKELLRGGGGPAEVRDCMGIAEAYNPVADELEALAQFVRYSVAAAKHKAGTAALATYELTKRLAKLPETAHLAPYVADMRRALGMKRKPSPEALAQRALKKAAKATPPAPATPTA
jgi:hypothetical protein